MDWGFDLDFSSTFDSFITGATEFGSTVLEGFEGVGEIVDSIFGEGVGMAAFQGAVLGGGVSLLTGEDIWKGMGIGGLAGGTLKTLDNKFDFFGDNTTSETNEESGTTAADFDPSSTQNSSSPVGDPTLVPNQLASQPTIASLAQDSDNAWIKNLFGIKEEDQTRSDGLLAGMFNFTDKEKRDFASGLLKTGGTLGAQYYLSKMQQEEADKREEEDYERDKKKYQEDVISTSVRPKISTSYSNDSQSATYRSKN